MTNIHVTKLREELKEHERFFCYCGNLLITQGDVERTMHEECAKRLDGDREIIIEERVEPIGIVQDEKPQCVNKSANICTTCKMLEKCGGVGAVVNSVGDFTGKLSNHGHEVANSLGIYVTRGWIDYRENICDKNQGE